MFHETAPRNFKFPRDPIQKKKFNIISDHHGDPTTTVIRPPRHRPRRPGVPRPPRRQSHWQRAWPAGVVSNGHRHPLWHAGTTSHTEPATPQHRPGPGRPVSPAQCHAGTTSHTEPATPQHRPGPGRPVSPARRAAAAAARGHWEAIAGGTLALALQRHF